MIEHIILSLSWAVLGLTTGAGIGLEVKRLCRI